MASAQEPVATSAPRKKAELKTYWERAYLTYDASLREADAEYARKHSHWWNRRREKRIERPPPLNSAKDFESELTRRQGELKGERRKGHAIFATLKSLAGPVEVIGGQASGIVGLVFPATPVIFGAVMYLFNAGTQVSDSFDTLIDLFRDCHDAIVQVNSLVENVRVLSPPLQDHVIETLVSILEVFRVASKFAADGKFAAYGKALLGAGGPEKESRETMKRLAKKRVATVVIDTLAAVDRADAKGDVRHKETGDLISSVKIEITGEIRQVQQMLVESKEKSGVTRMPRKETKDAKQKAEDRAKRDLEAILRPDKDVSNQLEEFVKTTVAGTCDWITKDPDFKTWLQDSDSPLLWIYGQPGVGKSHLAARLVRYFGKSHLLGDKETEVAKVAAYFCEYNDTETREIFPLEPEANMEDTEISENLVEVQPVQDAEPKSDSSDPITGDNKVLNDSLEPGHLIIPISDPVTEVFPEIQVMNRSEIRAEALIVKDEDSDTDAGQTTFPTTLLRTLCWQLAEDEKPYRKYLIDHLDSIRNMSADTQPLYTIWQTLFRNPYFAGLKDRSIVCVIDGLDNVAKSDRNILYDFFYSVVNDVESPESIPIKFIILCQPTLRDEVLDSAPGILSSEILVTPDKNKNDIITYILATFQSSRKISRALKDEKFRTDTVTKLADSTGGIFEMGALLLKQLAQKDHVDMFTNVLERPPKSVQNILEQTLTHFGETHSAQDIEDFNCILAWVLHGMEYMTLSKLNAAVGLESEHGEFLDIREKIEREFSAYFAIVDLRGQHSSNYDSRIREDDESVKSHDSDQDPDEMGPTFDPDLDIPTVRISHASIAKFFRSPRSTLNSEKGIVMGMSREVAHLQLAKTCLKAICTIETPKQPWDATGSANKLLSYAALYFDKHLAHARSSASLEDKLEIFRLLTKLFRDENIIARWVRETVLYPDWFDADSACGTVWSWFSDPEVLEKVKEEEKAWITRPEIPIVEKVLKPIATWFAKKWLEDPDVELNNQAFYFFVFLTGFLKLFERSKETTEPTPGNHPFEYTQAMNADEIIKIAEWPNFPKTPLWHTRVGYNISNSGQDSTEEAVKQFEIAVGLDPGFGQAFFALATKHADLEKYDLAITEMAEARRLKYNVEGGSDRRAAVLIGKWQEQKADTKEARDEALKTLDEALEKYPNDFEVISVFITIAGKASLYRDIVSKLAILGTKLPDFLKSAWASDLHRIIRRAAQKLKRVGILKKSYEAAIEKSKRDLKMRQELLEALALLYAENQEADQAIKIYEMLIETAEKNDNTYTASDANDKISILLFLGAWNLGGTAAERETYLNKLIQKEKDEEHPSDNGAVSEINYSYGLQIAFYYRLSNEGEKAKPYFRDRIARAMFLLDDDDTDNDEEAWSMLKDILYKTGDLAGAKTAAGRYQMEWLRMMNMVDEEKKEVETENEKDPKTETSIDTMATKASPLIESETQNGIPNRSPEKDVFKEPPKTQAAASQNVNSTFEYTLLPWKIGSCDGICDRDMSVYDRGIWVCLHCINTWFCTDCYEKHKENEIPFIVCDSDHDFEYTMGAPKGLKSEEVLVGGKVRNIWEWLDEIRKIWGLPLRKVEGAGSQVNSMGKAAI